MSRTAYTHSSISTVASRFTGAQGHSMPERLAAARAVLRYRLRSDGADLTTRSPNGLHPMYIALHGQGNGSGTIEVDERRHVLSDTLEDILDAVRLFGIFNERGRLTLYLSSLPWTVVTYRFRLCWNRYRDTPDFGPRTSDRSDSAPRLRMLRTVVHE